MNIFLKGFVVTLIFALGMQAAHANKAEDRNVTDIIVNAEGRVTVKLSGSVVNPAGCQNSAYVIEETAVTRKDWLAMLLTAKAAGSTVTLVIAPTNGDCANDGKNPRIINIQG